MGSARCCRCRWLGATDADHPFDDAVVALCDGATIDLGCGPGRMVARLISRGLPALGIDQSAAAVRLAGRRGAPALHCDIFDRLPGLGAWHTVLLVDGNVGLGGDPVRVLGRAAQLICASGQCVVEFDATVSGVQMRRVRLECDNGAGPWFNWAVAGLDSAPNLAEQAGLHLTQLHPVGTRVLAQLVKAT